MAILCAAWEPQYNMLFQYNQEIYIYKTNLCTPQESIKKTLNTTAKGLRKICENLKYFSRGKTKPAHQISKKRAKTNF
jgi:hypothetical protein